MPRTKAGYGWVPDLPDPRDHNYSAPPPAPGGLPPIVVLHNLVTTVFDQGDLGSCTANAIGQAIMMLLRRQKSPVIVPSRLFIYYNERVMEDTIASDSGAQIRDGVKSVAQIGVCPEEEWPYHEDQFSQRPHEDCYTQASDHQVLRYMRLNPTVRQLHGCLASNFPFVFGISIFESFESDAVLDTGNVPMPGRDESCVGGHAVIAIGINVGPDIQLSLGDVWPSKTLLVQNSWGRHWGMKSYPGCFTIPLEYVTLQHPGLADDFWTLRLIEG